MSFKIKLLLILFINISCHSLPLIITHTFVTKFVQTHKQQLKLKHTDEGEIHQSTLVHKTVLEIEIENRNRNLEIELELEISRLFSSYVCDVRQK